jgi:hypothetical protein
MPDGEVPRKEPKLADILEEPVIKAMMDRDGVTSDDLRRLVATMRTRLVARDIVQLARVAP